MTNKTIDCQCGHSITDHLTVCDDCSCYKFESKSQPTPNPQETVDQELAYIRQCGYCGHQERYILRSNNTNSMLSDKQATNIALNGFDNAHIGHCESCKMITMQTTVAYDLGDING